MVHSFRSVSGLIRLVMQQFTFAVLCLLAVTLVAHVTLALLGLLDWLHLPLTFGAQTYENAGIAVEIGTMALVVGLCFFLPTNARIMALENSHRSFQMGMQDVARAYSTAHAADRAGTFQLKSEFDSIRERIAFLRDHPELAELEPSVLEVASQMSHVSRELADTYSDDKLARAQDFLTARQQEIDDFNTRIEKAKSMAVEIRRWTEQVELEESVINSQLTRLRDELAELLPELDTPPDAPHPDPDAQQAEIVTLDPSKAAKSEKLAAE